MKKKTSTSTFDETKATYHLSHEGGRLFAVVSFPGQEPQKLWADTAIADPDKLAKLEARLADLASAALAAMAVEDA